MRGWQGWKPKLWEVVTLMGQERKQGHQLAADCSIESIEVIRFRMYFEEKAHNAC